MVDESLYVYMRLQLELTTSGFHRYLYERVNWSARMVAITGARGVGKSTMVLQYLKAQPSDSKFLYVSADHTYFSTHSLVDVADEFSKDSGQLLVIDEVHKYSDWSRQLKQIYDTHPDMRIIFTGSSVLDIMDGVADLSRRVLHYTMYGLSFREYLELFRGYIRIQFFAGGYTWRQGTCRWAYSSSSAFQTVSSRGLLSICTGRRFPYEDAECHNQDDRVRHSAICGDEGHYGEETQETARSDFDARSIQAERRQPCFGNRCQSQQYSGLSDVAGESTADRPASG